MRIVMILLAAVLAVTGCSTPQQPGPQTGVLTVGLKEQKQPVFNRMINHALYTPLIDYDAATGKVTPVGAESVSTTDQITWTIKLRPSRYHDGVPVTASSYVDAWLLLAEVLVPYQEIVPVDELTIRYVAKKPASFLPAFLASPYAAPVRTNGSIYNPVGNGPFKLAVPWDNTKGGRLTRVDQVGSKAREIDLRVYADAGVAFDDVRAGKLDMVVDIPGNRHEAMHQDFADRHTTWPKPEAAYLVFGPDLPDPAARYAIAMSIDRKALAEGVMDNQVDPATGLYPPAVAPGERSGICRACNTDPAAAKTLREQADLKSVTIRSTEGNNKQAAAIADQLRAGLGVTTDSGPGPELITWAWDIDSPHDLFNDRMNVPSAKAFLDAAAASNDPEERAQNYRLIENEILRDLTIVPLWTGHGHAVWSERVRDVTANAAHGIDLTAVTLA
ncbi:oligopeptide transport system substrate-binding protein [Kibdelosporangium banguiense]|uniref:Oligopeptide transport system substrate-binding protein n=1 Tax=Kibdelosporangium banguiense TaxID=1365924 RepID=A0ABS4TMR5_9PSEU|nr:ABC transporter substrate-binding protein [Kibdelosporangium banguiense]MBP2325702.1 oligopeptide transport system substrate-binding protein [Kibdelosporangium banguiense]